MDGSKVFSKLGMFVSYWKISLPEGVAEKTGFRCKFGPFQFGVMPLGFMNAPSTVQRICYGYENKYVRRSVIDVSYDCDW